MLGTATDESLSGHRVEPASVSRWPGLAVFVLALVPSLAAVWAYPGFVTQDGSAHVYNAWILRESFGAHSPLNDTFVVRWDPLPNWAGHLTLMGLLCIFQPRVADRAMTTVTLVGFSASLVWLRWRVAGWRGMPMAALLAVMLGLNMCWIYGFSSFLIGAALFPIVLGAWWAGRDSGWSWGRAAIIGALMALGYFCHLISMGLTVIGLVVLEVFTPGPRRLGRAATTFVGLLPCLPLAAIYLRLSRGGGGMAPVWKHLKDPFSARSWAEQLLWVEPVTLASKKVIPLLGKETVLYAPFTPISLFCVALMLLLLATFAAWLRTRPSAHPPLRGWWILAAVLLTGGVIGPDTLGSDNGFYLQQRVVLLGLASLVPVLWLGTGGRLGGASAVFLIGALAIQSATVWHYAHLSERTAGAILRATPAVGTNQRIGTLFTGIREFGFRSNPILHADCAVGVGTDNVVWANYETQFYYFPVHFRDGLERPVTGEFEELSKLDNPEHSSERLSRWTALLTSYHDVIDVLLVWGQQPDLDAVSERWYRVTYTDGQLRVFHKKSTE